MSATHDEGIDFQRHGETALIVLDKPPLNLLTMDLFEALRATVSRIKRMPGIRSVILHQGSARAFSAGSDMNEFGTLGEDAVRRKILPEDHALRSLASLPVPVLAVIEGPALGGGLELALACDLRVAGRNAEFGLTESRIGGLAGSGSQRLPRLIGPARALQMLYLGETCDAATALDWGLVNWVFDAGTALTRARDIAAVINTRGPLSNRLAKSLVAQSLDETLDAGLSKAVRAQEQIFESEDLHEGARAFFGKRDPVFTGR